MIANRSYDCIVVGGGPGGSTAAAIVAEQGNSVLLSERDTVPREHGGESLMPEAYWIFERLGIVHEMDRVGFTRKHGVQFVSSSGKESKPFIFADHDDRPSKESWHVKRDQFDKLLYDTATLKAPSGPEAATQKSLVFFRRNPKTLGFGTSHCTMAPSALDWLATTNFCSNEAVLRSKLSMPR